MRNSSRFLIAVFAIQITLSSCKVDTFDMYKDSMYEDWQSPKDRKVVGNENNLNDLRGCPVLVEIGKWKKAKWENNAWSVPQSWIDGTMYNGTGIGLDFKNNLSNKILPNKLLYPIYIGPWHPITLSRTEGSFFSKKEIKEQKTIRLFAYTGIGGGEARYQYESQTEENKNIPEKKFSLPSKTRDGSPAIPPKRFDLCVVKWIAKFGYNAVAEVKSTNTFSKNYLVPTGRIIDSETGKIIEAKE